VNEKEGFEGYDNKDSYVAIKSSHLVHSSSQISSFAIRGLGLVIFSTS
jgi:hypothetical protein